MAKRDAIASRTRFEDAPAHRAVWGAESCAAPAPADIGVNAQWSVKEHTSRKESPPDRFRRKLGFEGCTWRTAAHTAQAEALRITKFRASLCDGRHDDGLDDGFDDGLDDKHQTLMPSRDRENAGRASYDTDPWTPRGHGL